MAPSHETKEESITVLVQTEQESQYLEGAKLYGILVGLTIATFLISLDVSVIATATPSITSQFHATTDIGWYGATYHLTMCSLQPLSGKISTTFSLRRSYLAFFAIFLLGSLLCGAATSSQMFIVGRAVAGIGGSGVVCGGLSVIAIVTPARQRPLFTGLMTSLYALGTVVAPIIGGSFTNYVTWRWCFLINLPAGAVTIVTLLLFYHPPEGASTEQTESIVQKVKQLDLIGCALFIPSIIMVMLAMEWGGEQYAWNSATIIGLFVGFAAEMIVFILWEIRTGEQAMIPFLLLGDQSVIFSILFAFFFMGSFVIPVYYLPEWFQIVKAASPIRSGVMLLPSICTQVAGSLVSGILAKSVRYYNPWFFAGSTFVCTATGLYTTFTAFTTSSGHWIGFQILQGFGCGFAAQMPLLTVQYVLREKPRHIPLGISTVLFAQYLSSAVMQSIGGSIFTNRLIAELLSNARLSAVQVNMLLDAGNSKVRDVISEHFPSHLDNIIVAYNDAITNVFFLAVAGSGLAFLLATGIKWRDTTKSIVGGVQPSEEVSDDSQRV
uniref:MFS transporter n=1 Tax=Talaromyces funiculosus TaxID=28572 RepID=A0A076L406_TALFU|nr:MFS transporter [Talaromyces funiculosus]